ncbi:hypothetical protein NKH77_02695 [Streptomyces sp. M19]
MRFHDRREAGRELAERLQQQQRDGGIRHPMVLAVTAGRSGGRRDRAGPARAARRGDRAQDRRTVRPRPHGGRGRVRGPALFDERALADLGLTPEALEQQVARERIFLHRDERLYRRGRPRATCCGEP